MLSTAASSVLGVFGAWWVAQCVDESSGGGGGTAGVRDGGGERARLVFINPMMI